MALVAKVLYDFGSDKASAADDDDFHVVHWSSLVAAVSSSRRDTELCFGQRLRVRRVVMNGTHFSPFCISPMIVIESAELNW